MDHCDVFSERAQKRMLTLLLQLSGRFLDHPEQIARPNSDGQVHVVQKLPKHEAEVVAFPDTHGERSQAADAVPRRSTVLAHPIVGRRHGPTS